MLARPAATLSPGALREAEDEDDESPDLPGEIADVVAAWAAARAVEPGALESAVRPLRERLARRSGLNEDEVGDVRWGRVPAAAYRWLMEFREPKVATQLISLVGLRCETTGSCHHCEDEEVHDEAAHAELPGATL